MYIYIYIYTLIIMIIIIIMIHIISGHHARQRGLARGLAEAPERDVLYIYIYV